MMVGLPQVNNTSSQGEGKAIYAGNSNISGQSIQGGAAIKVMAMKTTQAKKVIK